MGKTWCISIIEEYVKAEFPSENIARISRSGAFGPYIPMEYGGVVLNQISYGLIMQKKLNVVILVVRYSIRAVVALSMEIRRTKHNTSKYLKLTGRMDRFFWN
jgi:hypothetical protein